jgi:transcriptional regulator GlxA family with amidase domain
MQKRRVGILVFDDFEPIDVWGFVQAFTIARPLGESYSSGEPIFEVVLIAVEKQPVRSYNGPRVMPDYDLAEAAALDFEILMVPGGFGTFTLVKNQLVLDWLRMMDTRVKIMASVCTGAMMLATLGMLDGLPAATNHNAFDSVRTYGPKVLWDNVSRWVDAGHYVTSAGVSAGTDMGFYLVQRLAGRAVADNAVTAAEYNWQRNP